MQNIKGKLNINKLVDFVFNDPLRIIKPLQVKREISDLLNILKKQKPKYLLEIGTAKGGTLFLFSQIVSQDATIISIDLPKGEFGGGYPKWKIPLYKSFAKKNQKIKLLRMNSHSKNTLEEVKKILDGNKLDFLFIDGDHTYEGVKKDFQIYQPLVKDNGIIALHDIAPHPLETECEVSKFWNEVKEKYKHTEIIENKNQGWGGIGIIKNFN